jgi:hypothetical protein
MYGFATYRYACGLAFNDAELDKFTGGFGRSLTTCVGLLGARPRLAAGFGLLLRVLVCHPSLPGYVLRLATLSALYGMYSHYCAFRFAVTYS